MPKKTRSQKIRAIARRAEAGNLYTFTTTATSNLNPSHHQSTTLHSTTFNRNDILKTLILGAVFIFAEIALYFFSGRLGW